MEVMTGTKSCGCLVAISLDRTAGQREDFEDLGYFVRFMDLEKARELLTKCKCSGYKEKTNR